MPFRLATLKLFGQSLSGNKKIAPKHNASKQFLVPVAGIEPARGISPKDFESSSSTNSNTPAVISELFPPIKQSRKLEGCLGGMLVNTNKYSIQMSLIFKGKRLSGRQRAK